jgi:gamma-butyrobetaine dioxygenase
MTEVLTPDFDSYWWIPITEVDSDVPMVRVHWPDGVSIDCFALWLFENTVAIDPITRESMIDPGSLPDASVLVDADLDQGALRLTWRDGQVSTVHPGWLRSVAEGHHVPGAVAELVTWDASIGEPPTFDGSEVLRDDAALEAWVAALVSHGLARLRSTAADREEMERIGRRIGPIRGSNIGDVFSVEAVSDEADSLANTGSNLGRHSDLPTRETPPVTSSCTASKTAWPEALRA